MEIANSETKIIYQWFLKEEFRAIQPRVKFNYIIHCPRGFSGVWSLFWMIRRCVITSVPWSLSKRHHDQCPSTLRLVPLACFFKFTSSVSVKPLWFVVYALPIIELEDTNRGEDTRMSKVPEIPLLSFLSLLSSTLEDFKLGLSSVDFDLIDRLYG